MVMMEKDKQHDFDELLNGVKSMLDNSIANLYRMTDICFDGMLDESSDTCKKIYFLIGELTRISNDVKELKEVTV